MDDLLTARDVAELAGLTLNTVHTYRCSGRLPAPSTYIGRTPLWERTQVEDWLSQRRPPGNPQWVRTESCQ